MTWWQALILGLVEGLTEYLPVSSTGHLILVQWLLGLDATDCQKQAINSYNIVIQAGAIAAVLGLYWSRIKQMAWGLGGRDEAGRRLLVNLVIAFLPAAVFGPLLHVRIKYYLFETWPVIAALFVGALLMLAVATNRRLSGLNQEGRDLDQLGWKLALLIGFSQCIAMWPGTSRSMMAIVAAMLLGLRARAAAEFSFLLGLLTLSAATAFEVRQAGGDMIRNVGWAAIVVGFIAATCSAAIAVRWFIRFLNRHGLAPFGWYRLVLASVLTVLILTGVMKLGDT